MSQYDVIIVGAGVAGLSAARRLVAQGVSRVLILEARDYVGGRTQTDTSPQLKAQVDVGASWIGANQPNLMTLVQEFGLHLVPQYESGANLVELSDGNMLRWDGSLTALASMPEMSEFGSMMEHLDNLAKSIDLDAPWKHPEALRLDHTTVRSYLETNMRSQQSLEVYDKFVTLVTAAETSEISVLDWLRFQKAGFGFASVQNTSGGAQDSRIAEGMQAIALKLHQSLGKGSVLLRHQVVAISEDKTYYTITSRVTNSDGSAKMTKFTTKYVVVAAPPHIVTSIQFEPALSPARRQAAMRMPMASTIKAYAFFNKAFWRQNGLNGFTMSTMGPVTQTYDVSDDKMEKPCMLMLINGWHARSMSLLRAEDRKAALLQHLAKVLGDESALHPIDYIEKNWLEDRFTDGCYGAMWSPGALSMFGPAIHHHHSRGVFFAGTETAAQWAGYVEGAIESGYKAAQQVHEAIQHSKIVSRRSRRSAKGAERSEGATVTPASRL